LLCRPWHRFSAELSDLARDATSRILATRRESRESIGTRCRLRCQRDGTFGRIFFARSIDDLQAKGEIAARLSIVESPLAFTRIRHISGIAKAATEVSRAPEGSVIITADDNLPDVKHRSAKSKGWEPGESGSGGGFRAVFSFCRVRYVPASNK